MATIEPRDPDAATPTEPAKGRLTPGLFKQAINGLRATYEGQGMPDGFRWHLEINRKEDGTPELIHWSNLEVRVPQSQPDQLARLDCELARILGASTDSPDGRSPPTFVEVTHLLRLAACALRRYMGGGQILPPLVDSSQLTAIPKRAPLLIDLVRLALSAPQTQRADEGVKGATDKLFDALRVWLQTTPQGDAVEDQMGRDAKWAHAGRSLLRAAKGTLERGAGPWNSMAAALAFMLSHSYGNEGIIEADDRQLSKVVKAIDLKLKGWPPALEATTKEKERLLEEVAIDVVCAAAKASGFKGARRRLFEADRKTQERLPPELQR